MGGKQAVFLDRAGRVVRKDWLAEMTFDQALNHAKEDLCEITRNTSGTSKRRKAPSLSKPDPKWKPMNARDVERMLLADGFRPIDTKTKRQLMAAGHWGMPAE